MTETVQSQAGDIAARSPVMRLTPECLRPYASLARLDRPIGIWLLLLPCWWSVCLAGGGLERWGLFVLFAVGAAAMRGAGCTINDIVDRNFDAKVARTAARPIASNAVGVEQAFLFLGVQLLIGLAVLLQFNVFSIALGASSLVLVALYPFMKRITYWPQAFLGLTINWGALTGWAAVHGSIGAAPLFLYAAGVFWTLGYDTIYAHQDREDDAMIGVKSTALRFGARTRFWLIGLYGSTILTLERAIDLSTLGAAAHVGPALGAAHLAWQIWRLDIDDPGGCLRLFKSNRDFGLMVFCGMIAGRYL